jgi:hypothetical protein
MFYVYLLKDGLTGAVFYVGKGTGNRRSKHLSIARGNSKNRQRNPKLYNKIADLLANSIPIISDVIFESVDEEICLKYEVAKICEIGLDNLCNLTNGGEGTSGYKISDESRKKLSEAHKGIRKGCKGRKWTEAEKKKLSDRKKGCASPWKGKHIPDEVKIKMSKSHKGKSFTEEHKRNLSESLKGRTFSEEHKDNIKKSKMKCNV